MKKVFYLILFLLLAGQANLKAQVAIGANEAPKDFSLLELNTTLAKLGLRLPQLTTEERDALTKTTHAQASPALAEGLTIYNIDTSCLDYWNGSKWISLCSENAIFEGGDCAENPLPSTGGSTSCAITDPDCDIEGEYSFTFISGEDFASIEITDAGAGKFTLTFDTNDRASERQAIVMVTSPCGTSNIYVFTQAGDTEGCGTTTVPAIRSVDDVTGLCGGGAVYLYLEGYPATGTFIWTLNGQQIATGNNYAATTPGKYIVYGDKIGCSNKQEFLLTMEGESAPPPVQLIVVGNNGVACGVGGTVPLITSAPVSGTVIWFKDGILQTDKTGSEIEAGKGNWEAVVKDGDCYSNPTAGVTVTENTSGGSITKPVIKINGLTSGWKLCRGGSLLLEIDGTPEPGVTYTWYADNIQIGTGTGVYYPVPTEDQVVIRLRATGTGCAQEAYTVEAIGIDQAPGAPFISSSTPGNALCGGEVTLSATGGDSYIWFKDGKEIPGQWASSLHVTQIGTYTAVAVSSGGCQSVQSGATVIVVSDFATLSWVSHPATANIGETKTYSVNLDFPQDASYTWTVTGGTITNGQGTSSITVNFPSTGSATVSCEATNACGNALDSPLMQTVTIGTACTDARIVSNSNLTPTITLGETATLSITATGTGLTYQWYTGSIGSGTAIGGATNAGYEYTGSTAGNFNLYCVATPSGTCNAATSAQFIVTVKPDPALLSAGTGSFAGKTNFDIASGNDNTNACAPLTDREGQKTDFSLTTPQDPTGSVSAPYTGVQVYTFTPTGTVSNVRFDYKDPSGKVIESISPNGNYSGSVTSGTACKVTVSYKSSLNNDLKGLTRANALKAELYAIYNNGTEDLAVRLTTSLQDCIHCGAFIDGGVWLTFMCHNLGANESLNPLAPAAGIHGAKYRFGAQKASLTMAQDQAGSGAISGWDNKPVEKTNVDWTPGNNPCPPGWRLPTKVEWEQVIKTTNNTQTSVGSTWTNSSSNYATGKKFGNALFLPAAGFRMASKLNSRGNAGQYWSSTTYSSSRSYCIEFSNSASSMANGDRTYGRPVRCVAE